MSAPEDRAPLHVALVVLAVLAWWVPACDLTVTPTAALSGSPVPTAEATPVRPAPTDLPELTPWLMPVSRAGWTSYTGVKAVRAMAFDYDGNLWAASDAGVIRWDLAANTATRCTTARGLAHNEVHAIAAAPARPGGSTLWFGTAAGVSRITAD